MVGDVQGFVHGFQATGYSTAATITPPNLLLLILLGRIHSSSETLDYQPIAPEIALALAPELAGIEPMVNARNLLADAAPHAIAVLHFHRLEHETHKVPYLLAVLVGQIAGAFQDAGHLVGAFVAGGRRGGWHTSLAVNGSQENT